MKMRLLVFATVGMAALICAPAIAQSPPPPAPEATMQPVANPPETAKVMRASKKRHARKMAKKMAKAEAAAAPPAAAPQ